MTAQHLLRKGRTSRGRGPIKGQGTRYATTGSCSCGEWAKQANVAPSAGGNKWIDELFEVHVKEVSA